MAKQGQWPAMAELEQNKFNIISLIVTKIF